MHACPFSYPASFACVYLAEEEIDLDLCTQSVLVISIRIDECTYIQATRLYLYTLMQENMHTYSKPSITT